MITATPRLSRRYAFVLRQLVWRDFKGRYAGSVLGFLWSFAQPLWQLLLFTFVFSTVMKVSLGGDARTESFTIYLFAGLLPWMAVQEGVQRSVTAITDNAMLVKRLRFPSEVLVLAVILAALLHEAIAGVVFVTLLLWSGELSWTSLPVLLLVLPLQLMLTLGLGLTLASVHVFFRDAAQVVGMLLQGWFFLTPIVYPLALVPERYQQWLYLNPLTTVVSLYRRSFLGGEPGGLMRGVPVLAIAAAALMVLGLWLFSRSKASFVDEI